MEEVCAIIPTPANVMKIKANGSHPDKERNKRLTPSITQAVIIILIRFLLDLRVAI
ncbi:hypothetical protein D3C80_2146830 [compost metagenome]